MKKLMIAAAAAAMIGGVEAATTNVYRFVANLQTTTGALVAGYDTYTQGYAAFGKNGNGGWWYKNAGLLGNVDVAEDGFTYSWNSSASDYLKKDLKWDIHSIDGVKKVPKLVINTNDGIIDQRTADWLKNLSDKYQLQSGNTWCCELWWTTKTTTAGGCYRVAGANYIDAEIEYVDNCCDDTSDPPLHGRFKTAAGENVLIYDTPTRYWSQNNCSFMNRFGGINADTATSLEIFSVVDNLKTAIGALDFDGYLAGQGYWQEINQKRVPVQISGSIVGYTAPSICEYCCTDPDSTIAFDCLDTRDTTTPNTAAYGTFYMQYISSK